MSFYGGFRSPWVEEMAVRSGVLSNYNILSELGAGSFGKTVLAKHAQTGLSCAIKIIPKTTEQVSSELHLATIVDHPSIVKCYEILDDESNYYLVTEYLPNGSLLNYVNMMGTLGEHICLDIMKQLVEGLDYLHRDIGAVHRDIKLENIMLDEVNNVKIIDFGLSNLMTSGREFMRTRCGSIAYASPEMLKNEPYTKATDIWSLGVVLYGMAYGKLPFDHEAMGGLIAQILFSEPEIMGTISSSLQDLLRKMLEKDPAERITMGGIRNHPWFSRQVGSSFLSIPIRRSILREGSQHSFGSQRQRSNSSTFLDSMYHKASGSMGTVGGETTRINVNQRSRRVSVTDRPPRLLEPQIQDESRTARRIKF
jgi:serine/threonine protein kinase